MSADSLGAYGFRLRGMEAAGQWLNQAPADWPDLTIRQRLGANTESTTLGSDSAEVALVDGRSISLRRTPAEACYVGESELSLAEVIHPFLAPAASVHAEWQGWIPIHAGAFYVNGGAWLLLANRVGGKSTTLAALAASGVPVLADDLVVLRGSRVMAGPRSVDLRQPGPFDATDLGKVGERRRWRMSLPSVVPEAPVVGAISLKWSTMSEVRPLSAADRSQAMKSALSMSVSPRLFLTTLAIPAYEIRRSRGAIDQTLRLVDEVTAFDRCQ